VVRKREVITVAAETRPRRVLNREVAKKEKKGNRKRRMEEIILIANSAVLVQAKTASLRRMEVMMRVMMMVM